MYSENDVIKNEIGKVRVRKGEKEKMNWKRKGKENNRTKQQNIHSRKCKITDDKIDSYYNKYLHRT